MLKKMIRKIVAAEFERYEKMVLDYEARINEMEQKVALALETAKEKNQIERTAKTKKWLTGYPDQTEAVSK